MRLFVGLLPPEGVLAEIEAALAPHRAAWPDLRWTHRESWHVTVAFYGEVPDRTAERLRPRLERAAARHPAQEVAFNGLGTFPRPAAARVLWAGLSGHLQALADSCLAAATREGVDTGQYRPFHPHLTVARARRRPVDVGPLLEKIPSYAGTPWTLAEIHLIQSHLGATPRYETLASWSLRPRPS